MVGERLRLLRQARGMSLDDLSAKLGGIVTKQAISKYERSLSQPSRKVLIRLAQALGIKTSSLWAEPHISVDFIAYRKGSGLLVKEQNRVKSLVTETLENWTSLLELMGGSLVSEIPVQSKKIEKVEDTEGVANEVRRKWKLGIDPIASVTDTLEAHNVFVVEVEAKDGFDGISAVARDENKKVRAAAVVSRRGVSGERQRLNLLHELGHLILNVPKEVNEEDAAFRFGKAFLAPREIVYKEIGRKRSLVSLDEMMLLKEKFGLSLQAIVYRLRELSIINQSCYSKWFTYINQQGWKKQEPEELKPETSQWLLRNVLRAVVEELITIKKAERLLGKKLNIKQETSLMKRRAFMQLSLEERRRILTKQAKKSAADYEYDQDWMNMRGPDDLDYQQYPRRRI
jgi:Zn-dependent peptidase ImmA (M78 family)/DNA-binding XRE family transcriptional regulator